MNTESCTRCGPGPCTYSRGGKVTRATCAVPRGQAPSAQDMAASGSGVYAYGIIPGRSAVVAHDGVVFSGRRGNRHAE